MRSAVRIQSPIPFLLTLLTFAVLAWLVTSANLTHAAPQPSQIFFGSVTVAGSAATDGIVIDAVINGTAYSYSVRGGGTAVTKNGSYGTNGANDFTVKADDPDTTSVEGGLKGQNIYFRISGVTADIQVVDPGDFSTCSGVTPPSAGTNVSSFPFCSGVLSRLNLSVTALPPGQPNELAASAGNAKVTLSWSAPSSDGGSAVTDYIVEYSTNGSSWNTFSDSVSASTGAVVPGLTNGTEYYFRVSAANNVGTGQPTGSVTATPSAGGVVGGGGGGASPTATPVPSGGTTVKKAGILQLSGLSVSPTTVEKGGTVTISFVVTNSGNELLNTTVNVIVDGVTEVSYLISDLTPGVSQSFSLTTSRSEFGTYLVEVGGLTASFTVGGPTPTPTPTPTGLPAVTGTVSVTASTSLEVSATEKAALEASLLSVLGVSATLDTTSVAANFSGGTLSYTLDIAGLTAGQRIVGALVFDLGNLSVNTVDGKGTAVVNLGGGLSISSGVTLEIVAGQLGIVLNAPRLLFQPAAPDATLISGGNADVQVIDVDFDIALLNLPDGASLTIDFAKDPSEFMGSARAVFQLAAVGLGGSVGALDEDVAFVIRVEKTLITNDDLGNTSITMKVSKKWHDDRVLQGKSIAIAKLDDLGNVYSELASCQGAGNEVDCTVEYTGAAGGLSVFALMAVTTAPVATATPIPAVPTPTPTKVVAIAATPTPQTAQPTPTSAPTATVAPSATPEPSVEVQPVTDDAGDGGLNIVLILILIVGGFAIVSGGIYFLRRSSSGGEAA